MLGAPSGPWAMAAAAPRHGSSFRVSSGARFAPTCRAAPSRGDPSEDKEDASDGGDSVEAQRSSLERVYWMAGGKKEEKRRGGGAGDKGFKNPFARDSVFSGTASRRAGGGQAGQDDGGASSSSSSSAWSSSSSSASSSSSGGRGDAGEKPLSPLDQLKRFQRYLADKNGIDLK